MRDISLHVLDLIESSIRAGATVVAVALIEDPEHDSLEITVEDNAPGLHVAPETATDPFHTAHRGKRTGLSLLRAAAERAEGTVAISRSQLGGARVAASMSLGHTDRSPLGDLATTLASVVVTNPRIDLRCRIRMGARECIVRASDVASELPAGRRGGLEVALRLREKIRAGLSELAVIG